MISYLLFMQVNQNLCINHITIVPTVGMGKIHYPLSNHMQVNNENAAVETNTNSSCKFYLIYFTLIQFNSFIFGL